jgi:hypothetical protein
MKTTAFKFLFTTAVCLLCSAQASKAYSVLSHEAIVDANWEKSLQPLLKNKFPGTTDSALKVAHSYAYGGAIAPDMGYFPFGSHLFTNLVHYVRSGDLVVALLAEAKDVNEYAFALGFMCHYMADKYGHFIGVNRSVPIVYPKLMQKFGAVVTYEEDKTAHRRTEFSFDVLQTAKGNYATLAYHDFIGFNVSRPVLERAFSKTYGLDLNDVFRDLSLSIATFRWSVKSLFPVFTKAAWNLKKNDILKSQPTATARNFRYRMRRANYYQEFGKEQKKPNIFVKTLSWFILVLPKIGPLKVLKIKAPGPVAEKLFIQSFDTVLLHCNDAVRILKSGPLTLSNIDFDTGNNTAPGEYKLADATYANVLLKLSKKEFKLLNNELKQNITGFYSQSKPTLTTRKQRKQWKKINAALEQLNTVKNL